MKKNIAVAILGGTGYGAGELLRFFAQDDDVEVVSVVSSSSAGQFIGDAHPHLCGFYDLKFDANLPFEKLLTAKQAVIFSSLPNGQSAKEITRLSEKIQQHGIKLIDLSGDFRLQNQSEHEQYYPDSKAPKELRAFFQYGLTELNREEIRSSTFVANPGCFATACILALAPLIEEKMQGSIVLDAKTGSSGSGRQLKDTTHHPTRHANFYAYKPFAHQHQPEILQTLNRCANNSIEAPLAFIPQSMPTVRGIYVCAHMTVQKAKSTEALIEKYSLFYKNSPFVRIRSEPAQLGNVIGTNFCDLSIHVKETQVLILSTIDNLGKGMAGQAIQNMNVMLGREEKAGLWAPALRLI